MPESSPRSEDRRALVRYATRVLSGRPYFRSKLQEKLYLKAEALDIGGPGEIITSILDELGSSGYLDDQYLAEAYVRRQLAKCYGSKIISLKLKFLGLDRDIVTGVLLSEATEEAEIASLRKYCGKFPRLDRRKIISKLYSRGYSGQIIKKVFDSDWLED